MNSRVVQRLRRIHQLGMAFLVYPGCVHTRFDHSLGVMHLAGRIADRIRLDPEERRLVRLAALLHDVGHGPFSHVTEPIMASLADVSSLPPDTPLNKVHEQVTIDLIRNDSELSQILSKKLRKSICELLDVVTGPRSVEHVLRSVVTGPMDADALDYLLRDSLMTGVEYGSIDCDWIIDGYCIACSSGERYLALRQDAVAAIEQVLVAYYHMTQMVYRHKVRRIADKMLQRAILYACEGTGRVAESIRQAFSFRPGDEKWREGFLSTDDWSLAAQLLSLSSTARARTLFDRLWQRRLTKQVFECTIDYVEEPMTRRRLVEEGDLQAQVEKRIVDELKLDPLLTMLDVREQKNPLYFEPTTLDNIPEEIVIVTPDGKTRFLKEVPGTIVQNVQVPAEASICVYAPVDGNTRRARKVEYKKLERGISKIIGELGT